MQSLLRQAFPIRQRDGAMTKEQSTFLRAIGRFVQQRIEKILQPLLARETAHVARIIKLEQELEALRESQKQFRYRGVWDETTTYFAGNFTTHDGGVFHCNVDGTNQRPARVATGN
jgi:predicted outer membrane repeat protein